MPCYFLFVPEQTSQENLRVQVDAALRQIRPWFMRPCIMRPYVNPALYQMDVPAVRYF